MPEIQVQEVMTNLVVMLFPSETVGAVAERLSRNGIGGAPVVEGGKVVGMLTGSDIVRAARKADEDGLGSHTVAEMMTLSPVTVGPSASVWEAADLFDRRHIKRLPVVDAEGYLIGIVSRGDVVRLVAKQRRAPLKQIAAPQLAG